MKLSRYFAALLTLAITLLIADKPALATDAPSQTTNLPAEQQELENLARSSSLERADMLPWHLKMSFELHDLHGKDRESGTLEEWWVSPGKAEIVVSSPSFPHLVGSSQIHISDRNTFLIEQLRLQVVRPVPDARTLPFAAQIIRSTMSVQDRPFQCLTVHGLQVAVSALDSSTFCVDPVTHLFRLEIAPGRGVITRNRTSQFRGVGLELDSTISYFGSLAATGHVDILESFDPSTHPIPLPPGTEPLLSCTVPAGNPLKGPPLVYPPSAHDRNLTGSVLLLVTLAETGSVSNAFVIASSDTLFNDPTADNVRRWTFSPARLNGRPIKLQALVAAAYY